MNSTQQHVIEKFISRYNLIHNFLKSSHDTKLLKVIEIISLIILVIILLIKEFKKIRRNNN